MSKQNIGHVHENEIEWMSIEHSNQYFFRYKKLGRAAGGQELGCSLYEIDPGKCSWPFHYHLNNEEALVVLEGEGVLRTNSSERPLKKGDYLAFPKGPQGAHKISNQSTSVLKVLIVSTMHEPDACVYPDSEKVGIYLGEEFAAADGQQHLFLSTKENLSYWDGEK